MPKAKSIHSAEQQYWCTLLVQFSHSGLTVVQFCCQHDIHKSSFYRWRKIFATDHSPKDKPTATSSTCFIPVHVQSPSDKNNDDPRLEVVLVNGTIVRVTKEFDPVLQRLLNVLEGKPC